MGELQKLISQIRQYLEKEMEGVERLIKRLQTARRKEGEKDEPGEEWKDGPHES